MATRFDQRHFVFHVVVYGVIRLTRPLPERQKNFEVQVLRQKAYAAAGVDIDAANRTKKRIGEAVRSTLDSAVLSDIGGFGGIYLPPWQDYTDPALVASTDSVGTKLKIAFVTGAHRIVGADIVAHCANDILAQGARPLFFLDYLGMGSHDPETAEEIIAGLIEGCKTCECALLGGEMAELPGLYAPGEYDLAGTIVGIAEKAKLINGSDVRPGDALVGLGSTGLHTNGYSLARKLLFETAGYEVNTYVERLGTTVAQALMAPHRCYTPSILPLLESLCIRGIAHITGGGLIDNLPRVLPEGLGARIFRRSWEQPSVFSLLQEIGQIEDLEMFQTFNMGVGLVLVVPPDQAEKTLEDLAKTEASSFHLGEVVKDPNHAVQIV